MKRLDKTGLLRIYGPTLFQGVQVWKGYSSYVREIPFDGVSMIDEISKAGVALVLSSQAHRDSELMSNRLFESLAAGALIICDENPFAKKFFGDSLLYIDSRAPIEQTYNDIVRHLEWARTQPDQALALIAKAHDIFRRKFNLIRNLTDLYNGLAERKCKLLARQNPPASKPVKIRLNLLMPEYSEAVLKDHIHSVCVQEYRNFSPVLVVDTRVAEKHRRKIATALAASPVQIEQLEMDYFRYAIHPEIKSRRRLGEVLQELLETVDGTDAFMVVAPNEKLFSNHLAILAGALQRDPSVGCAATAALLMDGDAPIHGVHERIDFGHVDPNAPVGYGRFIFRLDAIPQDVGIALPYLDGRPLAVLTDGASIDQQRPASIIIDMQHQFPERTWDDAVEHEVIRDFCPDAFKVASGFGPCPESRPAVVTMTKLQFACSFLNPRWLRKQVRYIRAQGLSARIKLFKQKLSLG